MLMRVKAARRSAHRTPGRLAGSLAVAVASFLTPSMGLAQQPSPSQSTQRDSGPTRWTPIGLAAGVGYGVVALTGDLRRHLAPGSGWHLDLRLPALWLSDRWRVEPGLGLDLWYPKRKGRIEIREGEFTGEIGDTRPLLLSIPLHLRLRHRIHERVALGPSGGLHWSGLSSEGEGESTARSRVQLSWLVGLGVDVALMQSREENGIAFDLFLATELTYRSLRLGSAGPGLDGDAVALQTHFGIGI